MSATIGSLIVDMKANTAKLDEQLKASKKHFSNMQHTINEVKGALIGLGAVTVMKDILGVVAANEKAFALLKSQVKATGGAAGFTAEGLQAMAMQMEHVSTFSHVAIEQGQAELMAFTNITGEQFKKTLQVSMDFAAVTGRNLPDALRTLGEAINNPVSSLGRLTQAGVSLSKEQQNQIKAMAASGNMIGAQNALLKDLQTSYGGAAEAARNTLGGALEGLKNDLADVLEGKDHSFDGATQAINQLGQTLNSPGVKEGFDNLISALAKVVSWVAKAITGFTEMGQGIGIVLAKVGGYGGQQNAGLASLDVEIKKIKDDIGSLQSQMNQPAYQTGAAQDFLQKKIDADKLILKNYMASRKALLSGKGGEILMPDTSGTTKPGKPGYSLPPLEHLDTMSDKQIAEMLKKTDIKIKQLSAEYPLKVPIHLKDLKSETDPQLKTMAAMGQQTASSMQSAFANILFNPFHSNLRSMVQGFAQSMAQMLAHAEATKLMDAIFGSGGGGSGQSGAASTFTSFFANMFSHHAGGGSVQANKPAWVGEAGTELFVPSSNGTIIPHNQLGGIGGTVHHTINIDARGAGPEVISRLEAMRHQIKAEMRGETEYRLSRNSWMTQP